MPRRAARSCCAESNADRFTLGLALALRAGDGALRLARDLAHDFFALFFRHVFDQHFIRLFKFWVGIDALHHAFTHPLLAVELAHFIQNDGAFQPVTGHPLQVSPVLGIFFDVGINFCLHFGINPVVGFGGRTCARSAIWRGSWFCCCAHNEFWLFVMFVNCRPQRRQSVFMDSTNPAVHWSRKSAGSAAAPARFREHRAASSFQSPWRATPPSPANWFWSVATRLETAPAPPTGFWLPA